MDRRSRADRALATVGEICDLINARKVRDAITRAREEIVPKAESLIREIDRVLDRAQEIKHGARSIARDLSIEEET